MNDVELEVSSINYNQVATNYKQGISKTSSCTISDFNKRATIYKELSF